MNILHIAFLQGAGRGDIGGSNLADLPLRESERDDPRMFEHEKACETCLSETGVKTKDGG
jgi:hypothetical protein